MSKLTFVSKAPETSIFRDALPWTILIVDDDESVHVMTNLALRGLKFHNRPLEILSAYTKAEAQQILLEKDDIAMAMLDVVMEEEDTGLQLVRFIREELHNKKIRIVLRTGQPGQAPEKDVIARYDINNYKDKTELSTQKLFSVTYTALRTYSHLCELDSHLRGLQQIIETTDSLDQEHSLKKFASGVLAQLGTFLKVGDGGILCVQQTNNELNDDRILVMTTDPLWLEENLTWSTLRVRPQVRDLIYRTFETKTNQYDTEHTCLFIGKANEAGMVAYLHCPSPEELTRVLLEVFCTKIAISFHNLRLYKQLEEANSLLEKKVEERTQELANVNERLNQLVNTDPLTEVPNRRCFFDALTREMARLSRSLTSTFSLAMIDIDHFKSINDNHGHLIGDKVLQEVARRIAISMRQMDILGRIGGEEFAVSFTGTALPEALQAAERLRLEVAGMPVTCEGVSVHVTISIGVVEVKTEEGITTLMSRADKLLYEAKHTGRNKVCAEKNASRI